MGTQKTWIQTYRQKESAMLKEWWPYGCFYRQWEAMFVSIFKFLRKAECLAFSKYQGETVRNWSWSLEWKGQERTTSFLECEGPQSTFWECLRYFSAHSPSGLNCLQFRERSVFFSSTVPLFAPPEASLPTGALTTPTQTPLRWCRVFSQLGSDPLPCAPTALCSRLWRLAHSSVHSSFKVRPRVVGLGR